MTRSSEICHFDIGIRNCGAGQTTIVGRNAGGGKGRRGIDGDGVGG